MVKPPQTSAKATTVKKLKDPGRVFYRPAVDEVLKRGERAEIEALLKGARDVKAKYGGLSQLITHLEGALEKAG
ncbi:MAG TPA: hypothetical protein VGD66_12820 [Allosphingosinicella sp.]|jgi:hypothetical protein